MSRYAATTKSGEEMAFGFDAPLCEYFADVYDEEDEMARGASSRGLCAFDGKYHSNTQMYDWIKAEMSETDWRKYHKMLDNILMDLPF